MNKFSIVIMSLFLLSSCAPVHYLSRDELASVKTKNNSVLRGVTSDGFLIKVTSVSIQSVDEKETNILNNNHFYEMVITPGRHIVKFDCEVKKFYIFFSTKTTVHHTRSLNIEPGKIYQATSDDECQLSFDISDITAETSSQL